jgi:hypothetical protein
MQLLRIILERGKEPQEGVISFESTHRLPGRRHLLKGLFLKDHICLDVTVRGLGAFVP